MQLLILFISPLPLSFHAWIKSTSTCTRLYRTLQPPGLWLFVHWRCDYSSPRCCDYPQFFGRTAPAQAAKWPKQACRTRQSISQRPEWTCALELVFSKTRSMATLIHIQCSTLVSVPSWPPPVREAFDFVLNYFGEVSYLHVYIVF